MVKTIIDEDAARAVRDAEAAEAELARLIERPAHLEAKREEIKERLANIARELGELPDRIEATRGAAARLRRVADAWTAAVE